MVWVIAQSPGRCPGYIDSSEGKEVLHERQQKAMVIENKTEREFSQEKNK